MECVVPTERHDVDVLVGGPAEGTPLKSLSATFESPIIEVQEFDKHKTPYWANAERASFGGGVAGYERTQVGPVRAYVYDDANDWGCPGQPLRMRTHRLMMWLVKQAGLS